MELQKRKPTRLRGYDYNTPGMYFVTICTKGKEKLLGNIVGEGLRALPSIKYTPIGEVVNEAILYLDSNYNQISVDKYVVMPNHIHLIIKITDSSGGHGDPPLQITDVIGRFKSFTTNKYGKPLWQRSFYDHIIRGEKDYVKIWEYIDANALKWKEDCFYIM